MLKRTCSSSQINLWIRFSLLFSSKFLFQDLNMQFHIIHIVAFFTLALVASHASLAPEQYWNSVLPNTPMPKAISALLQQDYAVDKSTSVNVGKGGVDVNAGKGKTAGVTGVNVGRKGVGVNTGRRTNVGVGTGHNYLNVATEHELPRMRTNVGVVRPPIRPPIFLNRYADAATDDELRRMRTNVGVGRGQKYNYAVSGVVFLEKDMHPGTAMNLNFNVITKNATLLPRHVANSIAFSSNKLPEILNYFSVKTGTVEAEIMQDTIKDCESPAIKGEDKYCATSLESMIDFSTSKLGKNVEAISTEVHAKTQFQKYKITAGGVTKMKSDKSVVCHKLNYAYAVFYCHVIQKTDSYVVRLEGADGTEANAVAVCHKDTSSWNPKHLAFQLLKVKPGTVPVCHFLSQDQIAWVQK